MYWWNFSHTTYTPVKTRQQFRFHILQTSSGFFGDLVTIQETVFGHYEYDTTLCSGDFMLNFAGVMNDFSFFYSF